MATRTEIDGLLRARLKSPGEVRNDANALLMQQTLASNPMQGIRGTTALPGIIANYGAQETQRAVQAGAGLLRGISGGIGSMVGGEFGESIENLGIPLAERQARSSQQIMQGVNIGDYKSLVKASKKLSDMGDYAGAQGLMAQARQLEASEADVGLTRSKILTEAATQADKLANSNLTKEQMTTEIMKRFPTISKIDAETLSSTAQARNYNASADATERKTPIELALLNTKNQAEIRNIALTNEKVALIRSQVTSEQVQQLADQQGITESEAKTRLLEAELERYIDMTPLEIVRANLDIIKTRADTSLVDAKTLKEKNQDKLAIARLGDIGMTEFLRELDQADLTEEERKKLVRQRVESRARTGDVSGVGTKVIDEKLRLITNKIDDAQGANKAMSTAVRIISVIPNLSTGIFEMPKAIFARIGSELGIPGAASTLFANELFGVLKEGLVLEKAGNLKGALSDKDLQFLKNSIGGRELNAKVIREIFANLYYSRYADQKVAEYLDGKLGEFSDTDINKYNVSKDTQNRYRLHYLEAKEELKLPSLN
tara:strand:+ start:63 stop:1700 length:1638 start_codon:yes stop_codon:yes gene_type:complete